MKNKHYFLDTDLTGRGVFEGAVCTLRQQYISELDIAVYFDRLGHFWQCLCIIAFCENMG